MYRCQICGANSSGEMRRNTTQTRPVEHPQRDYKDRRGKKIYDPGGKGTQIVKELAVCSLCHIPPVTPEVPEPVEDEVADDQ